MSADIRKIIRSIRFAVKGISHAYAGDKSFRLEVWYGIPAYLLVGFVLFPFSAGEFLFYVFSYVLILIVELMNTAFEKMLDRVHPGEHELIAKSKDIASAAVLLSFCFAILVVATLFVARLSRETLFFIAPFA